MAKSLLALIELLLLGKAADGAKPNIILIYIDKLEFGDIVPFGSTKNRTPRLDQMARDGMRLTSFYAAPVCAVSRAQATTGCYGPRVSVPACSFRRARMG
jgi:arylsulfatase A